MRRDPRFQRFNTIAYASTNLHSGNALCRQRVQVLLRYAEHVRCLDLCVRALQKSAAKPSTVRNQQEEARRLRATAEARRQAEEQEQRRQQLQQALLRAQDEAKIEVLAGYLERMRVADLIREYVRRLAATVTANGAIIDANSKLGRWMEWARRRAQRLDPCRPEVVETDEALAALETL